MAPGALLACICAWSVLFTHARAVAPGQRTRLGLAQARSAGVARHEAGNSQCRVALIEPDCDWDACAAAPPGRRYVVLSSDTGDMKYAAFLPLTAFIWARKHNVKPIVILVTEGRLSAQTKYVAAWAAKAGGIVRFVAPGDHGDPKTLSQVARLAAFALGVARDNDVLVTADADIWPLSSSYWAALLGGAHDVVIANGDFFRQQAGTDNRIALSYVAAKACLWNFVVSHGLSDGRAAPAPLLSPSRHACAPLAHNTAACVASSILDKGANRYGNRWTDDSPDKESSAKWSWDQVFLTESVLALNETARLSTLFGRDLSARRLDRANWAFNGRPESYTDAHLPHADVTAGRWDALAPLWLHLFPGRAAWAEAYVAGFPR
jgi:hypothetical protein